MVHDFRWEADHDSQSARGAEADPPDEAAGLEDVAVRPLPDATLRAGLAAGRTDREQADVVEARQRVRRDAAAGRAAPRDGAQLAEPGFAEQPPVLPAWQPQEPVQQVARAEVRLAPTESVSLRPAPSQ